MPNADLSSLLSNLSALLNQSFQSFKEETPKEGTESVLNLNSMVNKLEEELKRILETFKKGDHSAESASLSNFSLESITQVVKDFLKIFVEAILKLLNDETAISKYAPVVNFIIDGIREWADLMRSPKAASAVKFVAALAIIAYGLAIPGALSLGIPILAWSVPEVLASIYRDKVKEENSIVLVANILAVVVSVVIAVFLTVLSLDAMVISGLLVIIVIPILSITALLVYGIFYALYALLGFEGTSDPVSNILSSIFVPIAELVIAAINQIGSTFEEIVAKLKVVLKDLSDKLSGDPNASPTTPPEPIPVA